MPLSKDDVGSPLPRPEEGGWRSRLAVVMVAFSCGALADGWLTARSVPAPEAGFPITTRFEDPALGSRAGGDAASHTPRAELAVAAGEVEPRREPSKRPTTRRPTAPGTRELRVPIDGSDPSSWKGSFEEPRTGHQHRAVDILAPRGTPVRAVDGGRIARRLETKGGGLTVYHVNPSGDIVYSYAHLDAFAEDLAEGDWVEPGQVVGYVGTTGNAPPTTPHLHFAIATLPQGGRWWEGTPLDPYVVFTEL